MKRSDSAVIERLQKIGRCAAEEPNNQIWQYSSIKGADKKRVVPDYAGRGGYYLPVFYP